MMKRALSYVTRLGGAISRFCTIGAGIATWRWPTLLPGGEAKRPVWVEAGTVMIAVDMSVHNFLHLRAFSGTAVRSTPMVPVPFLARLRRDIELAAAIDAKAG
jgi:hypothetical protein